MAQKRHTVDQIVAKLRKADVELGKGKKVPEVCKCGGEFDVDWGEGVVRVSPKA